MRPDLVRKRAAELRGEGKAKVAVRFEVAEKQRAHLAQELAVLTSSELWNKYLSLVVELQARDERVLDALEQRAHSTEYESPEESSKRHFEASVVRERILARAQCIHIPQALLSGEDAPQESE